MTKLYAHAGLLMAVLALSAGTYALREDMAQDAAFGQESAVVQTFEDGSRIETRTLQDGTQQRLEYDPAGKLDAEITIQEENGCRTVVLERDGRVTKTVYNMETGKTQIFRKPVDAPDHTYELVMEFDQESLPMP